MDYYVWEDCETMLDSPNTLIAGTVGSGKSTLLNSVIFTAMVKGYKYHLIDLKRVELAKYKNTKGCLSFTTELEDVSVVLQGIITTMDKRYRKMEKTGIYKTEEEHIYIFIDELGHLINDRTALNCLVTIGRLGRAAGIHIVAATQDPSRRTLCAQLMQNFTCCVALRCRSAIESRQIIGVAGAETLPPHGKAIMWDAEGIRKFSVPMTPEEDIASLIKDLQAPSILERFDAPRKRIVSLIASGCIM